MTATPRPAPGLNRTLGLLIILLALAAAVYGETTTHDFIRLDDDLYVTDNARVKSGLSWPGVRWAFTDTRGGIWHPLTWLSHMLDVELFGMNAGRHHLVNVLLHMANTLLLFLVLRGMTAAPWRSFLAAALFAVHPLHVESVAWIAERKDLLSTLFWFLTMGAYVRYLRRPATGRYLLLLLAFVLGLLAKPMLVTLPFALLLLDGWPLGRFRIPGADPGKQRAACPQRPPVFEKVPLLIVAGLFAGIAYITQKKGGALRLEEVYPLAEQLQVAAWAYGQYLVKTLWPADLAILYPHPGSSLPGAAVALSALVIATLSWLAVRMRTVRPWLAPGWFWFLGTLIPVIGIVQIGIQAFADRYTYVPLVGLFISFAWSLGPRASAPRRVVWVRVGGVAVLLAALALAARRQAGYWRESIPLFEHALAVTGDNRVLEVNLGVVMAAAGRHEDAIAHYARAIRISPREAKAHVNIAIEYVKLRRWPEAIAGYTKAIEIDPFSTDARLGLGQLYASLGRRDLAQRECDALRTFNPAAADYLAKFVGFTRSAF